MAALTLLGRPGVFTGEAIPAITEEDKTNLLLTTRKGAPSVEVAAHAITEMDKAYLLGTIRKRTQAKYRSTKEPHVSVLYNRSSQVIKGQVSSWEVKFPMTF